MGIIYNKQYFLLKTHSYHCITVAIFINYFINIDSNF